MQKWSWMQMQMECSTILSLGYIISFACWPDVFRFFSETQDLLQFMIYNPAQDAIPTPPGISHLRKYMKLRHPIKSSETLRWKYIKLFGMCA